MAQPLGKRVRRFLQRFNRQLPYISNPASECIPKRCKGKDAETYWHNPVHRGVIHNGQNVEETLASADGWMDGWMDG